MQQTVKQRLIEYIKFKGISVREFCRTIGVSETYVSSMRTSIQPDKLMSVAEHYPDLNSIWLMTGVGEMINDKSEMPIIDRKNLVMLGAEVFKDKLIAMFVSGEIYSAAVVREKDDFICKLNQKIALLEDVIMHKEDEIKELRRQLGLPEQQEQK